MSEVQPPPTAGDSVIRVTSTFDAGTTYVLIRDDFDKVWRYSCGGVAVNPLPSEHIEVIYDAGAVNG